MKHILTSLITAAILFSCNPDKNKRADPDKIKFTTTDDAELFFKNIRQQAYDLEEMKAANLLVYRHEDRKINPDYPLLQPALVVNWLHDEAYLLLEPNEQIPNNEPLLIAWQDSLQHKSGEYRFEFGSKEEHLRFAGELYSSILDGHKLYYVSDSVAIPFLSNNTDRKIFRHSLLDYYRLTGNIR
jgi:hypothetical protein